MAKLNFINIPQMDSFVTVLKPSQATGIPLPDPPSTHSGWPLFGVVCVREVFLTHLKQVYVNVNRRARQTGPMCTLNGVQSITNKGRQLLDELKQELIG